MNDTTTKPRRLARTLFTLAAIIGVTAAAIWGFIEGREELALEAEREQPVKPPQRISLAAGEPTVTLDAATQEQSGLKTVALKPTRYHEQLRGYATILDPQLLVDLDNSSLLAKAQLNGALAKLDASKAEFERDQALFNMKNTVMTVEKLQAIEATYLSDQAALTSAQAQVRTLEETAEQTWGPVIGHQFGEDNPVVARLVKRQDYLVQVTLPPGVVISKAPGTATIELENGEREDIEFISTTTKTNASIQGLSFFYTVAASSDLLPGMTLLAFLPLESTIDGVVVPGRRSCGGRGAPGCMSKPTRPALCARRSPPTIPCLRADTSSRT
jgi:hypothetical protein